MNPFAIAILCVIAAAVAGFVGFLFGLMQGALKVRVHYDELKHKYELLRTDHQEVLNKVGNLYNEIAKPSVEEENKS